MQCCIINIVRGVFFHGRTSLEYHVVIRSVLDIAHSSCALDDCMLIQQNVLLIYPSFARQNFSDKIGSRLRETSRTLEGAAPPRFPLKRGIGHYYPMLLADRHE